MPLSKKFYDKWVKDLENLKTIIDKDNKMKLKNEIRSLREQLEIEGESLKVTLDKLRKKEERLKQLEEIEKTNNEGYVPHISVKLFVRDLRKDPTFHDCTKNIWISTNSNYPGSGVRVPIRLMSDNHLMNAVNCISNTHICWSAMQDELHRRGLK